jgi:hypothetical protein
MTNDARRWTSRELYDLVSKHPEIFPGDKYEFNEEDGDWYMCLPRMKRFDMGVGAAKVAESVLQLINQRMRRTGADAFTDLSIAATEYLKTRPKPR